MGELKTSRPFQERFLDNFDRSKLRQEVQAVRPKKLQGLRKKYATWALGATLAAGSLGVPMKMMKSSGDFVGRSQKTAVADTVNTDGGLQEDLRAAGSIASQVAGGVAGGVEAAVKGVEQAAAAPIEAVAEAPKTLTLMTERVREDFFRSEVPFGSIIYKEAKKNNVRPELVAAVVQAESRFKPTARSGAGAVGLMQLVPKTGRWMGAKNLTDPGQNIAAGAKYLKYLHERFDGNETKMIAAYNAGEGNVKRFGGVPPFRETRNYVKKVRNYEQEFKDRVAGHTAELNLASADTAGVTR
jgi:Transglycosylase SLT domain